ncbi:MAG: importin 11 [Trebouxia sp. A1-2]|nr:MAG: importin 11 [Trebouxia sp. A1-2]
METTQKLDGEERLIHARTVMNAVQMSMDSQNPQSRAEAEAALRSWESDAAPGFLQALLDISRESEAVGENVRLLATVLAKNAVGSSWRKTLGTREWSRIPETEKSCVRSAAASLLLNEPQRRVATQTGLLIANIARFDFPAKWPTLLSDLTSAAWWVEDGATQAKIEQNDRALFTLKHVVRAVKSKRIVVETSGPSGGSVSTAELKPLADKIAHERKMLNTKAEEIFPILRQQWQQHFIAFMDTR